MPKQIATLPRSEGVAVRVTFVLPTRNRADHLDATLAHVRELKGPQDELIIVDGASTDGTLAVIEKHRELIDQFLSEPDRGEAHAFNKGIMLARGEYLKLLTDDDRFYKAALETALQTLAAHPEIEALMCGGESYEAMSGEQKFIRNIFLPQGKNLMETPMNFTEFTSCGIGLVFRRSAISRIGLLDASFKAVDTELLLRMHALNLNFKYLDVKLFRHIGYPHSGQNDQPKMQRDLCRALLMKGYWETMIDLSDQTHFAESLGMAKLPYGPSFAKLIFNVEKIRRGSFGWMVPLCYLGARAIAWAERVFRAPQRAYNQIFHPLPKIPRPTATWDGTLR